MNSTANHLTLYVNRECNLRCPYCFLGTYKNTVLRLDYLEKLLNFKNLKRILIAGGEPGLLNYNKLLYIIEFLKKAFCNVDISIATNGYLIENSTILSTGNKLLYHANHPKYFKNYNNELVYNNVVLSRYNIKEWLSYIKENETIKFNVTTDITSNSIDSHPILHEFITLQNIELLSVKNIIYSNPKLYSALKTRKTKNPDKTVINYNCTNFNLYT